jgi:flagellar hook assembly protein FlgD
LEKNASVVLSVYDVTGKKIAEQSAGEQSAGSHTIEFNAENLSAGVYYYSVKAGENTSSSIKMVIIK